MTGGSRIAGFEAEQRLRSILRRFDSDVDVRSDRGPPNTDVTALLPGIGEVNFQLKFLAHASPSAVRQWLTHHRPRAQDGPLTYKVLSAPWFSERAMDECEAAGVGALDLAGNYRLAFLSYRLERIGHPPPKRARRELVNLYTGKTLRVVRALLANPERTWQVQELARICEVSLGTASIARNKLILEGWLERRRAGSKLEDPEGLLRQWAEWAKPLGGASSDAYTTLHGSRLFDVMATLRVPHLVLGGTSAASWMSPFLLNKSTVLYTDPDSWRTAMGTLRAETVEKGGSLTVRFVEDDGVFLDRIEVKPGLWTASPAQTFVDLWQQGNRGREAAEKLLQDYIRPIWQGERPYKAWPLKERSMERP